MGATDAAKLQQRIEELNEAYSALLLEHEKIKYLAASPEIELKLAIFDRIPMPVWACDRTGRDLGVSDHGSMVWDEIVAFLPLLAISSQDWRLQLFAFALFRGFDIWKPFPIRELEKRVKGGMGVMIDDVVAAFYAYVVFVIAIIVAYKILGVEA